MAEQDVDSMDRGALVQAITDSGIPFDAASHIDQLRATVRRDVLRPEDGTGRC